MTRDEHVDYLLCTAVRTTPCDIPHTVLTQLEAVFCWLLQAIDNWRKGTCDDLPHLLTECQCTDCIVGVAGDLLGDLTGDPRWGFGRQVGADGISLQPLGNPRE